MRKSFAFMLVQKKKELEIFHIIIIDFYVAINSLIEDKLPSQFLVTAH